MLIVDNIQCHYNCEPGKAPKPVLKNISFHVNKGEICSLLGPSGCGKTTALRAIAGFQPITTGSISLNERPLSTANYQLPPDQRQIGMVFQDYALFPHLNVRDNIHFGIQKLPANEQQQIVEELLALIQLEDIDERYPHELSGGQQQRVALARALAPNPTLLLLDEPFSNLDVELRRHLNLEVRSILKQRGTSAILVTHDQDEAFAFSDHIGLLNDGSLQQWDTAFNLFHEPCNRFVANFIGQGRLLPGAVNTPTSIVTELGLITGNRAYPWIAGTAVDILLRPDDIVLNGDNGIEATITAKVFTGSTTLYTLKLPSGHPVDVLLPSKHDFQQGATLTIKHQIEHLIAFATDE